MKNDAVKLGLLYGLITIGLALLSYYVMPESIASFTSIPSILNWIFMIGFLYMASKRARDAKGGYIAFGEALVPPMVTYGIGTLISGVFSYLMINFIDPSLLDTIQEAVKNMSEGMWDTMGLTEDQKLEAAEKMEEQQAGQFGLAQTALGWLMGLILGLIISAIVAAIVKKEEPMPVV